MPFTSQEAVNNEQARQILLDARAQIIDAHMRASLNHAAKHVMGEDISYFDRYIKYKLGAPPWPVNLPPLQTGMEYCPTQKHQHEVGDKQCGCIHVEKCGCDVDSDNVSTCTRCERCETCCRNASECFWCGGCEETQATADRCRQCGKCESCCNEESNCFECGGCGVRRSTDSSCGNCNSSTYCCCSCRSCGECGEYTDGLCDSCNYCDDCCRNNDNCEAEGKFLKFRKRRLVFHSSDRKQFKLNLLKRHLSCEIEVDKADGDEPVALDRAVDKWGDSVVEDRSLDGKYAHEINTMPTNGDRFVEHITDLTRGYAAVDGDCSKDCGLHVHVDARDLGLYDLRKVIILYAKVERALFELCSPRRLNAHYSAICGYSYLNGSRNPVMFKRQLLGALYNNNQVLADKKQAKINLHINDKRSDKYQPVRYRALNLHSYFLRKTVEFRHHEGTTSKEDIVNWALICGHVVETAYVKSEAFLTALLPDPYSALLAAIPDSLHEYCKSMWKLYPTLPLGDVDDDVIRPENRESEWARLNGKVGLPQEVIKPPAPKSSMTSEEIRAEALARAREAGCDCGTCISHFSQQIAAQQAADLAADLINVAAF